MFEPERRGAGKEEEGEDRGRDQTALRETHNEDSEEMGEEVSRMERGHSRAACEPEYFPRWNYFAHPMVVSDPEQLGKKSDRFHLPFHKINFFFWWSSSISRRSRDVVRYIKNTMYETVKPGYAELPREKKKTFEKQIERYVT